jgi:phosphatidylserine/phosphatidylglycerophosphate/cardiolipin synthase-like enzyme
MRNTAAGLVNVRAVSGTHVVFLAFNMKEADASGLMGFAIQRNDYTDKETTWLKGNKTFPSIRPSTGIEDASSHEHPFQSFQWADYSAKPGYKYNYRVIPMYGKPGALEEKESTSIEITTEPLAGGTHEVHFNRGAIASQAFAKKFPGLTFEQAGDPAKAWLARDLLPALLEFISRAKDKTYSLHAAIFEVQLSEVLQAFEAASDLGAKVEIIYHDKDDDTGRGNNKVLEEDPKFRSLCISRTNATLMHNKFIVLSKSGKPVSVWTGSTNLSESALFGQLNVGHVINDDGTASAFLDYWAELKSDPVKEVLKDWADSNNPMPQNNEAENIASIFSPHKGRGILDWWIELAGNANKALFMTFPFGMGADFRPVFDKNDDILRFALLDKYMNGGTKDSRATAVAEIERIRRKPNIGLALGERIFVDWIDGWRKEASPIGFHVDWVHTKFMLIDPLGNNPTTLSGSANWSEASVSDNDENMLIIRGDTRVADIYFGEFMRVFAHHRFRESVAKHIKEFGTKAHNTWKPQDLFENWNDWVTNQFKKGSEHDIKRRYFADERT